MFIEDNRKDNLVTFGSINEGECFEFDGHIYLRMEGIGVYHHPDDETIYNAVDLEYGDVDAFDDLTSVTPLKDAKITIS